MHLIVVLLLIIVTFPFIVFLWGSYVVWVLDYLTIK